MFIDRLSLYPKLCHFESPIAQFENTCKSFKFSYGHVPKHKPHDLGTFVQKKCF